MLRTALGILLAYCVICLAMLTIRAEDAPNLSRADNVGVEEPQPLLYELQPSGEFGVLLSDGKSHHAQPLQESASSVKLPSD